MVKALTIAWKDIRLRFSSRSELLFFLVLPIAFTTILGGTFFGDDGASEPGVPLLVVDEDRSVHSAELLSILDASDAVLLEPMARDEGESTFEDQAYAGLLIVPAGFEANLLAGVPARLELRSIPNDLDSLAVEQAVRAAAHTLGRPLGVARASLAEGERLRPFENDQARAAYFEAGLEQAQDLVEASPGLIDVTLPLTQAGQEDDWYDPGSQAASGQLITWVFIPLLATSELFAFERGRGTLRRLITTPTRTATFLCGTIAGQLGASIFQMALLIGFGVGVLGIDWGSSPAGLAILLVSFALAAVALGTTLGTFVKTEGQASGLSIMLGMAMALLGGCWYPSELFPEVARTAARVLPTSWAMQGLTDLTMHGRGMAEILPEAGVLLGFAAMFFVIGVLRFRYE